MSTNLRTPHNLKKGPEYNEIEVSWTIVTVIGKGKSLRSIFPMTLLLLLTMYRSKHKLTTVSSSLVCLLSTAMLAYVVSNLRQRLQERQNGACKTWRLTVRLRISNCNESWWSEGNFSRSNSKPASSPKITHNSETGIHCFKVDNIGEDKSAGTCWKEDGG